MEFLKSWYITLQILLRSSAFNKSVTFLNILLWTVLICPDLSSAELKTSLNCPQEGNFFFPECYKKYKKLYKEDEKERRNIKVEIFVNFAFR